MPSPYGHKFRIRQPRRRLELEDPLKAREMAAGGSDMEAMRQMSGLPPAAPPPSEKPKGTIARAKAVIAKVQEALE